MLNFWAFRFILKGVTLHTMGHGCMHMNDVITRTDFFPDQINRNTGLYSVPLTLFQ